MASERREGLVEQIIEFSAHNKFLVLTLVAAAIAAAV